MYLTNSARLILADSVIAGNLARSSAGLGMWANATAQLDRVIVRDNKAQKWGGGMSVGLVAKVIVPQKLPQQHQWCRWWRCLCE